MADCPRGATLSDNAGRRQHYGASGGRGADPFTILNPLHLTHADVFAEDEIVLHEVLEDHPDAPAQGLHVPVAQVAAVEQDAVAIWKAQLEAARATVAQAGVKLAKQAYDIVPKMLKAGGDGVQGASFLKGVGFPAAFFCAHTGLSGRKGRMRIRGSAGITPEISV